VNTLRQDLKELFHNGALEEENYETLGDIFINSLDWPNHTEAIRGWLTSKNISTTLEEHVGGESEGTTYYTVWQFARGEEKLFLKFSGWYSSYIGYEFEEMYEVEQVEVVKMEWKAITNQQGENL